MAAIPIPSPSPSATATSTNQELDLSPPPSPQSSSPARSTSSFLSSTDTSTAPSTPGDSSASNPMDPPPVVVTDTAKPVVAAAAVLFPPLVDPSTSTSSSSTLPVDEQLTTPREEDPALRTIRAGISSLSTRSSPSLPSTTEPTSSPSTQPPPLLPRSTAPIPPPVVRRPGLGVGLKAGVRGAPGIGGAGGGMKIPPSLQAKMAALASRSSSASSSSSSVPTISSTSSSGAATPLPSSSTGSPSIAFRPAPAIPAGKSRMGAGPGGPAARKRPGLTLAAMGIDRESEEPRAPGGALNPVNANGVNGQPARTNTGGTPFANFSKIVDPSGTLTFASKAVVHASGVDFSSGASFKIQMSDFELGEELGKGNYGTVKRVRHAKTGVVMALKEIRLELDDSKLKTIITELDILHRATSPYIIDFYGAFFIESCVYYCMEYMDAGSLEKVSGCDVKEEILARTTRDIVRGLKFLKDELKIMHRDVKPTNVLINRQGFVKLCDFGVSGQLDRSLAKTNIGCQSYMAPERIKGESMGAPTSYTASSDVWSLGLSVIEFAIGHYPYPPETYQNVFAQLTAIVHGDPPCLPGGEGEVTPVVKKVEVKEGEVKVDDGEELVGKIKYSECAREFVAACLRKQANLRPTYAELLEHPFLTADEGREVDVAGWIGKALEFRQKYPRVDKPALA